MQGHVGYDVQSKCFYFIISFFCSVIFCIRARHTVHGGKCTYVYVITVTVLKL